MTGSAARPGEGGWRPGGPAGAGRPAERHGLRLPLVVHRPTGKVGRAEAPRAATGEAPAMSRPKLTSLTDIYTFFRTNETPIYFVTPVPFGPAEISR